MRLFAAVNFSHDTKSILSEKTAQLQREGVIGSPTNVKNFHLTLAFIGETDKPEKAISALKTIASIKPFTISLRGWGFFGDVLWAGVKENGELTALAENVSFALRESGFSIEKRPFKPHVTLMRRVKDASKVKDFNLFCREEVRFISLMRSDRINEKLIYTEIYKKELK